jgi:Mitochondrial carrier protein
VADDGIKGLYAGINGSLIGVASTNFAYFYWYSVVRTLYMSSRALPKPPGTIAELSLGAVSGAIAQVFTIPVAVITTRQQTQGKLERKGLLETGRDVVNSEDGWTGLWRGLKASLVLVVNPAITYGAYQRLKDVIFPGKSNLRPWEAFCRLRRRFITFLFANRSQSLRCNVEVTSHNSNSASHSSKSGASVQTTPLSKGQAIQELH